MSEKRANRGIGCLGAICGWLALSALTTATFVWLSAGQLVHPVMVFNFKIIEGAILGAVSALALAWTLCGEFRRVGWMMVIWSALFLMGWCALFAMDALFPSAPDVSGERIALGLGWGGASIAWALALLLCGCVLLRRGRK